MSVYYKAVRPNGRDFYTDTVQWAPPEGHDGEWVVKHPTSTVAVLGDFSTLLSVSTNPTDLPGSSWPLRLLEVEPVGDVLEVSERKWGAVAFRVVSEVDAHLRFGPQGVHVAALIERAGRLTSAEARSLCVARGAAWNAARNAAWDAARGAAWDAAWHAAGDAAWNAAGNAAGALVIRDLIGQHRFTQAHYDTITGPWRTIIGPIHPDDAAVSS